MAETGLDNEADFVNEAEHELLKTKEWYCTPLEPVASSSALKRKVDCRCGGRENAEKGLALPEWDRSVAMPT